MLSWARVQGMREESRLQCQPDDAVPPRSGLLSTTERYDSSSTPRRVFLK